jgi:hypothetical protein
MALRLPQTFHQDRPWGWTSSGGLGVGGALGNAITIGPLEIMTTSFNLSSGKGLTGVLLTNLFGGTLVSETGLIMAERRIRIGFDRLSCRVRPKMAWPARAAYRELQPQVIFAENANHLFLNTALSDFDAVFSSHPLR